MWLCGLVASLTYLLSFSIGDLLLALLLSSQFRAAERQDPRSGFFGHCQGVREPTERRAFSRKSGSAREALSRFSVLFGLLSRPCLVRKLTRWPEILVPCISYSSDRSSSADSKEEIVEYVSLSSRFFVGSSYVLNSPAYQPTGDTGTLHLPQRQGLLKGGELSCAWRVMAWLGTKHVSCAFGKHQRRIDSFFGSSACGCFLGFPLHLGSSRELELSSESLRWDGIVVKDRRYQRKRFGFALELGASDLPYFVPKRRCRRRSGMEGSLYGVVALYPARSLITSPLSSLGLTTAAGFPAC
jgi:hypothetical protein